MKKLILALSIITFFLASCSGDDHTTTTPTTITTDLQDGDIIFQTSKSTQSKAIQLATGSKYSHVGIIYLKNNKTFVYEAVQPVKLTPLKDWIKRGEGLHYVVKRLKDAETILTPEVRSKMGSFGESFKGKSYDIYFEWSDDRIYCSELVWKIYHTAAGVDIGELEKLSSFNLDEPAVKQKLSERYGNDIQLSSSYIS